MYVVMYIVAAEPFLEFSENVVEILFTIGSGIIGEMLVEYARYIKMKIWHQY